MRWLTMPMAMLNACLVMLPRLRAREAIAGVHVGAVAAGTLKEDSRDKVWASWERALGRVSPTMPKRKFSVDAARAMGIEVELVPVKAAE